MPRNELKQFIENNVDDYRILLGMENRDLSDGELLNRDYYQGRFATKEIMENITLIGTDMKKDIQNKEHIKGFNQIKIRFEYFKSRCLQQITNN